MLSKRTYDGRAPSFKKQKTKKTNYPGAGSYTSLTKTFGKGFNPKAQSLGMNPEKKYHDAIAVLTGGSWTAAAGQTPTYAAITSLNLIAAGNNMNNREGNKICVKNLSIRGEVATERQNNGTFNNLVGTSQTMFRVMVIVDTQSNGANAPLTDIFNLDSALNPVNSWNKLEETGRFKTLYDKWITLHPAIVTEAGGTYYVGGSQAHYKANIKLNLPIMYGDAAANLTSVRNNNMFFLVFTDRPTGDSLAVSFRSRVRYYDY